MEKRREEEKDGGRKGQRGRHKRTAGQMGGKEEGRKDGREKKKEEGRKEGKKKGRECWGKGRKERMKVKWRKACSRTSL